MNIDMLFCIVLMVLGAFLIYYPIKDESPRQKLKKLADSVASDKKDIDYLIQRFSYLLDNMAADNGKGSALRCQIAKLEEVVKELNGKRKELELNNRSMTDVNDELKRSNAELLRKASELRDEIQQQEIKIQQQEEYINSVQRVKEGLEIALDNIQAEEVHYLSQPIFSMKMTPIVRSKLESHGILYVGDLIQLKDETERKRCVVRYGCHTNQRPLVSSETRINNGLIHGREQRITRVLQDIPCGHLYLRADGVLRVCHRPCHARPLGWHTD